jgi:hypothetical protein
VFDEPLSRRHNDSVFRPATRKASGLVIAPFLVFGSGLAPLHAHEPGAGHSHALVHNHFEPHHLESHEPEGAEVERGAARVIWLESAILHQTAYQIYPALPLVTASFDAIPPDRFWSATPFDDVAPVHGPPRRHPSFRGPPLFLA